MQYLCLFNSLPHVSFLNFFCPKEEWVHFRRQNGEYILYFITEGEMYLREDGKEHVLREGDAFLLQPGLLHEGTKAARCAYYFAHFNNLSLLPFEGESDVHFLQYDEGGEAQFDMGHCLLPKHIHLYDQELRERVVQCGWSGPRRGPAMLSRNVAVHFRINFLYKNPRKPFGMTRPGKRTATFIRKRPHPIIPIFRITP